MADLPPVSCCCPVEVVDAAAKYEPPIDSYSSSSPPPGLKVRYGGRSGWSYSSRVQSAEAQQKWKKQTKIEFWSSPPSSTSRRRQRQLLLQVLITVANERRSKRETCALIVVVMQWVPKASWVVGFATTCAISMLRSMLVAICMVFFFPLRFCNFILRTICHLWFTLIPLPSKI